MGESLPHQQGRWNCLSRHLRDAWMEACFLTGLLGFWLLSYMSFLYILAINPSSDIWLANIFSHCFSFCWVFLLLCRSLLVWCSPASLFLLLLPLLLVSKKKKKSLSWLMSRKLRPVFSSRIFMVSGHTFKSLIPFELFLWVV